MRVKRFVLIVLATLLSAAATGALYQTLSVRRDAARFPPPGRLVDVGGRRLHLLRIGDGRPTVIFEASMLSNSVSFTEARAAIARRTRICSYDRMGTGWSDAGPATISIGALADDLDRLLDRAVASPPYIVEAASIGGVVAELYARRHPERVAGLVFVDAGHSAVLEAIASRVTATVTAEACLLPLAARLGLLRAIDPLGLRRAPAGDDAMWRIYRVEPMTTFCGIVRSRATTLQEFREAPPLRADVPLTVLTAESTEGLIPFGFTDQANGLARDWRGLQQQLSRRSSRGTWRMVAGSDHLIGNSQPHAVAAAVLELLDQLGAPE
jgi:pimeloyl-ACP methyl ester carboxylesterase